MPGYHDPIQHNRRISSFSLNTIEEYFSQLNPIAKRIAYDIKDTKTNYGHLWDSLDYHEQNDIINDTLIRPEISLRYFDNFLTPTPTTSSGNSYQSSTDSLTAIVLKDVGVSRHGVDREREDKRITFKSYGVRNSQGTKHIYSYDGRNLRTFGMQKVALKILQDDTLRVFRDEHSRPFCYRTKSQINLFVLPTNAETMGIQKPVFGNRSAPADPKISDNCTCEDETSKKMLDNYHRLQYQLKMNIEKQSQDLQNTCATVKPSSISTNRKIPKSPEPFYKKEIRDKVSSSLKNTKSSLLKNYISSTQSNVASELGNNYVVFSDTYNTAEESFNLLQHCGQNDLNFGSCSSATTSDDEKTLEEEDVHLLDTDSNIRKGFDFLNNW